jgi:hypothetical protein
MAPKLQVAVGAFLLIAAVNSFSVAHAQAGVAPLTPAMECSACEVTAREIYKQYNARSKNDKYAGTEVEIADVLDEACKTVGQTYAVAQEAFGAHLKVFADSRSKYDMQNVEVPDFFDAKDEDQYRGATLRLAHRCSELIEVYEDDIVDHIKRRATEDELRKFMCLEKRDVCSDKVLKPYRAKESAKRKKWKRKTNKEKAEAKLKAELEKEAAAEERRAQRAAKKEEERKRKLVDPTLPVKDSVLKGASTNPKPSTNPTPNPSSSSPSPTEGSGKQSDL